MAFKLQSNFDRKQSNIELNNRLTESMNTSNSLTGSNIKDDGLIESLRKLVKEYLEIVCFFLYKINIFKIYVHSTIFKIKNCNETALFWADKINFLVKDSIKDLYIFIDCLYHCGQYQRALSIIKEKDFHKVHKINLNY